MDAWRSVTHAWEGWVFVLVLSVLVPFHGVLAYGRLKSAPDPIPTRQKLRLYATIVAMEWALVFVAMVIMHRHGLTFADLGQTVGDTRRTLLVTAGGFLVLLGLTLFNRKQIRHARREELEATVERARKFVPVGGAQIAAFSLVALTAGICEEILYRGWLVRFLGATLGSVWIGMVAAGVLFGIGHAYQGRQGMIATGILGLVFGTLFVLVRSLVPGEAIHAGIDLVNGVLAGRVVGRLDAEPAPNATSE
jgi:CAAX protease family protein